MKNRNLSLLFKRLSIITLALATVTFSCVTALGASLPDEAAAADINNMYLPPFVYASPPDNSQKCSLKLFGSVPVKDVKITERQKVIVCGTPFGIKIFTEGVMVVGLSDVRSDGNKSNPAYDAGIRMGDVIITIGGESVSSNEQVAEVIERSRGRALKVVLRRKGKKKQLKILPKRSDDDGKFKAGMWVRDSSAGLGTMTFAYPKTGQYAAVGHAICDADTGKILPLSSGEIVGVEIYNIEKSSAARTGQICGGFTSERLGDLQINCECGLFGRLHDLPTGSTTEIAYKSEVECGKATIVTTVSGERMEYDAQIERIFTSGEHDMIVKVTDERLLGKTGGIVQGMSGSPILQNGRLIGAVTHVLVDDPTMGYAIFAEDMAEKMK